jgi:FkbM family methyltransferase
VLTSDEVIWGYRYVLGRDPESAAVIEGHMRVYRDWRHFRQALLSSAEFARGGLPKPTSEKWIASEILNNQRLIWLDLMDDYVSRGCLLDAYEQAETGLLKQYLKPDHVFLDIGANIGWFTLLASTIIGQQGHIHAFEPRRPTVDYLRRSVAANGLEAMVTVHDLALDRAAGAQRLGWAKGTRNPGHSKLTDGSEETLETIAVQAATLDELALGGVDFIKIDVEGAEMRVFEGAIRTIDTNRPIILSEIFPEQLHRVSGVTAQDVFSWFASRGYRGLIADRERTGEEISAFPGDWKRELLNVIFLPA